MSSRTTIAIAAVAVIVILVAGVLFYATQTGNTSTTSSSSQSSTSSSSSLTSSSLSLSSSQLSSISSSSSTPLVSTSSSSPSTTSSSTSSLSYSSSSSSSTSSTTPSSTTSSSSSSATVGQNDYNFLIFTQKGIAELASPGGSLLGYTRIFNISDSVPAQTFYWEGYPVQGSAQSNFLVPINNGTVIEVSGSTLQRVGTLSVGTATGFIGVAASPDEKYAAIADGPSGVVEVVNLANFQVVWQNTFKTPSGPTSFPCDIRWSPDESTLAVPMKNNGTVDVVSATTGAIVSEATLPLATNPFMLTINSQGTMLAVELSGNKTDVFYSYPALQAVGKTSFSPSTFSPTRGVFTPDGSYYVEGSGATNVLEVVSTSTFQVVNVINLPASSSAGLADMEITPDGDSIYVVEHGSPSTGGIIYLLSISTIASATQATASIPLTTAPAFAIPVTIAYGTYLADDVLQPPVTGLHC